MADGRPHARRGFVQRGNQGGEELGQMAPLKIVVAIDHEPTGLALYHISWVKGRGGGVEEVEEVEEEEEEVEEEEEGRRRRNPAAHAEPAAAARDLISRRAAALLTGARNKRIPRYFVQKNPIIFLPHSSPLPLPSFFNPLLWRIGSRKRGTMW